MANLQILGTLGSAAAVHPMPPISTTPTDDSDETSKLKQMKPHVPGIVIFADHNRQLPWSVTYHAVTLFADVSGFTALCEKYSTMGQSGVDQLTRTLNEYISALVEGILCSDGDILKFAGDAILAIWRVGRLEELQSEIVKVLQCCMEMQEVCGEWDTDIGVKLTVKIGVAAGEMSVTFLGNSEYRHYVELGPAISAVNIAENFCQSGMVVVSPCTWDHCSKELFELETMEDEKHMRVLGVKSPKRARSHSLPIPNLHRQPTQGRCRSEDDKLDGIPEQFAAKSSTENVQSRRNSLLSTSLASPNSDMKPPSIEITSEEEIDQKYDTVRNESPKPEMKATPIKNIVPTKIKIGTKFGKLRKLVETVTEMKLDVALRLYILSPVLKKIDDNQPLAYLSEMRQVSIVFMNLVLNADIEAELLLQRIFEVVYARTKSMHGALNKVFLFDKGCTFLVIFGLPGYKHEDDCVHALTCSGRMKSQLDKMEGVEHVSIGVTTGTTFCGVVGHSQRHEYSVIGRKVNMAARLMMHYPDKITCDEDTYQICRLPPTLFEVLITKRMKGLRNVGVIRQFTGYSKDEKLIARSIIHTDYPVLGRQMEDFMFREQLKLVRREENKRQHLVFSGPSGIGKTKVLDQALCIAVQENFKSISCRVEMEDSSYPYFVASHILRSLLGNAGYTDQIAMEPYIVDAVGKDSDFLYVLNDVLGSKIEKPVSLLGQEINEKQKRKVLFRKIASQCLDPGGTIVIIDDAHNIDTFSWMFLCELLPLKHCLIVLSIRPSILDSPSCREARYFLEHSEVKVIDLDALDLKFVAPLACQMMEVFSIPRELDRLLRERSQGVPSWCMENLRHMLDQKQVKIVIDDDRPEFQQDAIVPNPALISRSTSTIANKLNVPTGNRLPLNLSLLESDDDRDILSELGYKTRSRGHLGVSLAEFRTGGYSKTAHLSYGRGNRIAIMTPGIDPEDIPIPDSMKELIVAKIDSMRSTDQLLIKCASVLGKVVRRDILEILLPKAHRPKLASNIHRLMESGIFKCSKATDELIKAATKEHHEMHKYYCFCFKADTEASSEEKEACFEPMFTHQLLQETAYEVLMASQRNELHTKAAHYLELCADELRNQIPFYVLFRPPADDLEEQTKRLDVKLDDVEAVIAVRTKRLQNKVADEAFRLEATEAKTKRGRRRAVFVLAEEAAPLVEKIAEGGTPLEPTSLYIRNLVPIYESLLHHWMCTNQIRSALLTLAEAVAACLAIEMTDKAYEFVKTAMELLASMEKDNPRLEKNQKLIAARIHRLHGEILYKAGAIGNTNAVLAKAADYIGLEIPRRESRSCLSILRSHIRFLICLKFHKQKRAPLDVFTLEQVYLLDDLFRMDKEQGNEGFKLSHALKQFMLVTSGIAHVHQVIAAYAAAIECSRERGWRDSCDMLQSELLHICASRKDELSSYDRGLLCQIYATSSTDYFLQGKISKATLAGIAAAEICVKIHNIKTTKYFAVFYFFLCLYRNELQKSFELLDVMKGAAHMSNDSHITVLYHVICIEIALAGGTPPERVHTCVTAVRNYLSNTRSIHYPTGNYAAMTVALWYARREMWAKSEQLLKDGDLLISEGVNFVSMLAKANCIECILLTNAATGTHYSMDKYSQKDMNKRIKITLEKAEHVPVIKPRFLHLQAYFEVLCNQTNHAEKLCKQAAKLCAKYGNVHEERWVNHNRGKWFGSVASKQDDVDINEEWKEHAQDCGVKLNPLAKDRELILYTFPHYHVSKD